MARDYNELINRRWDEGFFLSVGLDPDLKKIPKHLIRSDENLVSSVLGSFCLGIARATADYAAAFKPNAAFFESFGSRGVDRLEQLIWELHALYPNIPVILDAKRADIGNTNTGYATFAFDRCQADAITVNPYFGAGAMKPFWERNDKGVIVLCRTSNPEAATMQDVLMPDGQPYYCHVARLISEQWNMGGNCSLVVGATPGCLEPLKKIRRIDGNIPILLPGLGTQGGEVEESVPLALNCHGRGLLANVSRAIMYASAGEDCFEAARKAAQQFHERIGACVLRQKKWSETLN